MSPFVATIRDAFTSPNPSRWTTVPDAAIAHDATARLPERSGFTRRFDRTWVRKCQPHARTAFRLSGPEYQASKQTRAGASPRAFAAAIMSRNRAFFVRFGASAGSTSR